MNKLLKYLLCLFIIPFSYLISQAQRITNRSYNAYLFVYFTGNEKAEEAVHFALSTDGYKYIALNNNKPVIASDSISSTGGIRDPHILRGEDGKTFYMVATDMVSAKGWNSNRAMVLLKSTDLIHWSHAVVNIEKQYPRKEQLERVWAPQTIYDRKANKYMIYWSMKYDNGPDQIMYAYANKDFTALETPPRLLFRNGDTFCIDADIIEKNGQFHLFVKTEGKGSGIKQAISSTLTSGYVLQDDYLQQTDQAVEGSSVFPLNDGSGYILMYDMYSSGKYQFTFSKDLKKFELADQQVFMDFHPRHGTVIPITAGEAEKLTSRWLSSKSILSNPLSKTIKTANIFFDTSNAVLMLPLKPDTKASHFNPEFLQLPGATINPAGFQDFSKGPVSYKISIKGQQPVRFTVKATHYNNPVLNGFYADPEVLYAQKTGRYYIYPTSDGFTGWSGNYFKAFSSPDLVHWKDEGTILKLGKDVSWADRNAWAPCIEEKKINGVYRYFYYFCAAQKIGVAVASDPAGPFQDIGRPLVKDLPAGVKGGQQIDPDVFTDPVSGKSYLYWGNGYMAGAELNSDMTSLKDSTVVMTPDNSFREGVYVFYRNGRYYFLWSENDTRDADYGVRYGYSTSPLGKITIPKHNSVITKNSSKGIYGTGHNSVLNIPGTDEWYIVYHRFNYPKGIHWGEAAGYNREVCIDRMTFTEDGFIEEVTPTHEGIGERH
ncbi:family 43 glycosylhydrolase [Filimonas effusa]|uniref:Beta-xylosidase n=1 Tax=Filimonas effusa TaxID=2508721 RepID=A0A4Q1D8J6_9BACT|nr:family 43 glycosylhydrolase [Filimonas effusa]RXK85530.1 beta-xylosidase [Filimonas effusa]